MLLKLVLVLLSCTLLIALCAGKKKSRSEEKSEKDVELGSSSQQHNDEIKSNKNNNETTPNTNHIQDNQLDVPHRIISESCQIPLSEIKLEYSVDKGTFGEVFKGRWKDNIIALKKTEINPDALKLVILANQVRNHPNLAFIYGYVHDPKGNFVVMEWIQDGCLRDVLKHETGHKMSLKSFVGIVKDLALAVSYLHREKIIHCDLASRNIMVNFEKGEISVKLCDFGLSVTKPTQLKIAPIKWTAPEVIDGALVTLKSDVWSFGILMWEIFSYGTEPFPGVNSLHMNSSIAKKGLLKPDIWYKFENLNFNGHNSPSTVYDIMLDCWRPNPDERPHIDRVYLSLTDYKSTLPDLNVPAKIFPVSVNITIPKQYGSYTLDSIGWSWDISREEAEKRLMYQPIGTFLVRFSPQNSFYVLSIWTADGFSHVGQISPQQGNSVTVQHQDQSATFPSMYDYIESLKTRGILRNPLQVISASENESKPIVVENFVEKRISNTNLE